MRQGIIAAVSDEPSATSVSMLVLRCRNAPKPPVKNFLFMKRTMEERMSCAIPMQTAFSRKNGMGKPHLMCPSERYIRGRSTASDQRRRRSSAGVSRSSRLSSS